MASLERDHEDRLRGISIGYGDDAKNYKKVAQLLGWSKKSRQPRETKNDGRPPDTTDALLGRPKNLGRPKGSVNIDRNPVTTYQGFVASNSAGRRNRCWLDAMTECLYALHTAVWYSSSTGKSAHIFCDLMSFFSSRSTWEMGQAGNIRSILSHAQNTLHRAIRNRCPLSFTPDEYASADQYFDGIFNLETRPQAPRSPPITQILFRVNINCKFVCSQDYEHVIIENNKRDSITLSHAYFDEEFPYSSTPEIIRKWSLTGLKKVSARHCRICKTKDSGVPFYERSKLSLDLPPPHLHINLDITYLLNTNKTEAYRMMRECDLPYKLVLNGITYTMCARGFWGGGALLV